MTKLSQLRPQSKNANKHTPRGLGALERSIQQDGWIGAITVAADGETFDGSARLETGVSKGFEDAIVIESDGTRPIVHIRTDIPTATDPRAKRLGVAANRVASLDLEWDTDVLAELNDEGLLDSLFLPDELEALLAVPVVAGDGGDDFDTTPQEGDTRVKRGDVWRVGRHRIGCLNSEEPEDIDKLFDGAVPDMVFADPPYGIGIVRANPVSPGDSVFGGMPAGSVGASKPFGKKTWVGNIGTHKGTIIKAGVYEPVIGDDKPYDPSFLLSLYPKATYILWGGNHYASRLPDSSCWIVWDKDNGESYFADAELAWVNKDTAVRIFKHMWNGLMKASERDERRVHPTQKPVALAEWCYEQYGKKDNIVFDPFLGSGMSLIAAEHQGRSVYGCELSEAYCDVILRRAEAEGISPIELVVENNGR